jgi:ferredoxin-type protein NapG
VLFADQAPCQLCEDLPCIAACAVEALVPVGGIQDVRMGVATITHRFCTAGQGCHACVSKCPTHALSMDFETLRLALTAEACVGCGICESICKTVNDRVAIRITPARTLDGQ